MRIWTSVAPAARTISTILLDVVPRTIESSTSTTRLPLRWARLALCFSLTPKWRISSVGSMKVRPTRSEEHTSELQSLMRISYAVFRLKKKKKLINKYKVYLDHKNH